VNYLFKACSLVWITDYQDPR